MSAASFLALDRVIAQDPGGRGIGRLRDPHALEAAARSLVTCRQVTLVSGFFIVDAGACETDGPPGTLALGDALARLGAEVQYLTDRHCHDVFHAAGFTPLHRYRPTMTPPRDGHLVAIERLGRGADGRYRNMAGVDVGARTEPVDELFLAARPPVATVGVGDGGNEIGMGRVRSQVVAHVAHGAAIACVVPTDHLVVAGTSNWGAWGLVAALSLLVGCDLLPSAAAATEQFERLLAAGAVDGKLGRPGRSVDGIPWDDNLRLLADLRRIVADATRAA